MSRLTLLLCLFGMTCSQVLAEQGTEAIFGGDYARKGELKYQAFLQLDGNHHCGAVIIDSHFILTAAHCVVKPPGTVILKSFRVLVGTHNLKAKHQHIIDPVEIIYIPKAFNFTTGEHDIAVLKLKNGLDLNAHHERIEKVHLPKADANFDGVTAVFSGYGIQSFKLRKTKAGKWEKYDKITDEKLKFAHSRILTNAKCAELKKKLIHPTSICGQIVQRGRVREGACNGDSGGPLVYENQIIGILSSGPFTCNESNDASVYTRVSSYANMIHNIINGKPGHDVTPVKVPQ